MVTSDKCLDKYELVEGNHVQSSATLQMSLTAEQAVLQNRDLVGLIVWNIPFPDLRSARRFAFINKVFQVTLDYCTTFSTSGPFSFNLLHLLTIIWFFFSFTWAVRLSCGLYSKHFQAFFSGVKKLLKTSKAEPIFEVECRRIDPKAESGGSWARAWRILFRAGKHQTLTLSSIFWSSGWLASPASAATGGKCDQCHKFVSERVNPTFHFFLSSSVHLFDTRATHLSSSLCPLLDPYWMQMASCRSSESVQWTTEVWRVVLHSFLLVLQSVAPRDVHKGSAARDPAM